jgi:phosphoribosylformylglycinamidine synthase
LANAGLLHSARDVSDGGLAVALAEASIGSGVGARIVLHPSAAELNYPDVFKLFTEEATQAVVTCAPEDVESLKTIADEFGFVTPLLLGATGGKRLEVVIGDKSLVSAIIEDLKQPWSSSLESTLHDQTANEVLA